jgi:surface carbohydrate biosynthesis protein (TIGR04326 family)
VSGAPSVIVWDQAADPAYGADRQVLCWQSYVHGGSIASIPRYLEEHADRIREKFLAFVHALGEHRIGGKRVVEHLDPGDGFSLWWMTLVAEKNPLKSQRMYDCLRLIALEEILAERECAELVLVSSSKPLSQALRDLCRSRSIAFRWQRCRSPVRDSAARRLYGALPAAVQGLLSLRHMATRIRLRALKRAGWFSDPAAVFFCSYFIHLDPALGALGRFHSRQWGSLPSRLHEGRVRTNWLQLFLLSAAVPDVGTGLRWAQAFNRDPIHEGRHVFLESFLSWRVLRDTLTRWCWLNRVRWRLSGIASAFRLKDGGLSLWPMLREQWLSSLTGAAGMGNCLHLALFDAALAGSPHQRTGLYLFEGQPWEVALLRAWRRHGHGRIIGVQHATTPFWYLPHAVDCGTRGGVGAPLPDCLAVNGAVARSAFAATGYPPERLADVEALRYLDLARLAERAAAGAARTGSARRVLVLGEIAPQSMQHLLSMLDEAFPKLPPAFSFAFKPHPSHSVNLGDYPRLQFRETNRALHELLGDFDVAIAGNSTSAAVDAYAAGLPVIVGLDGASLNLSPLRGHAGVYFVTTGKELIEALRCTSLRAATDVCREGLFFLDPALRRWRRLLEHASAG